MPAMPYLRYIKGKILEWEADQKFHHLWSSGIDNLQDIFLQTIQKHQAKFTELFESKHRHQWGGMEMLIEAIRQHHDLNQLEDRSDPIGILPVAGASPALWFVFQAMRSKGCGDADRVLIETPTYGPFFDIPEYMGIQVDWLLRHGPEFKFQLDDVPPRVTPSTRLIVLSNLHNPSGHSVTEETLKQIAAAAKTKNPEVKILVDETFADFLGTPYRPAATLDPCFISVSSLSKVYSLGSLRCGWIMARGETFKAITEAWLQGQNIGSPILDALATIVFEDIKLYEEWSKQVMAKNRAIAKEAFASIGDRIECDFPEHGCICFPRVLGMSSTDALVERLEREHHVGVIPGRYFNRSYAL
jgi:aspartate/methionine/tyrosine aminotransferase